MTEKHKSALPSCSHQLPSSQGLRFVIKMSKYDLCGGINRNEFLMLLCCELFLTSEGVHARGSLKTAFIRWLPAQETRTYKLCSVKLRLFFGHFSNLCYLSWNTDNSYFSRLLKMAQSDKKHWLLRTQRLTVMNSHISLHDVLKGFSVSQSILIIASSQKYLSVKCKVDTFFFFFSDTQKQILSQECSNVITFSQNFWY